MDKRAWLRSRGFEVGERGRFSAEMIEALKEYEESDSQNSLIATVTEAGLPASVARTPLRESRELYGYDNAGHKVGFVTCFECAEHMMWCECDSITAPTIVATCSDPLVRVRAAVVQSSSN